MLPAIIVGINVAHTNKTGVIAELPKDMAAFRETIGTLRKFRRRQP
jgi:hypothetical protein